LHGDVLTLSGERKEDEVFEKAETYRTERFLGKFQRSLTLPVSVDANKVQAEYKDGILTVTLPKAEEAKPKHIEVKVS
jgi:HSP20 family protein